MSRMSVVTVFCCMIAHGFGRCRRPHGAKWNAGFTSASGPAFRFAPCRLQKPLSLRPGQRDLAFGAEYVAVEIGDPLPADLGLVEIADLGLDVRRDAVPVELRIAVHDVGGRVIT